MQPDKKSGKKQYDCLLTSHIHKGTVIKKDSDVTIVVTPEGETIKQEKDKDGNIKKEEHYVDENPFER